MLLDFKSLVHKYNLQIRGVVHCGAHKLQEYHTYKDLGVQNIIAIEPCKPAFEFLKDRFKNAHDVTLFNCACSDYNGTTQMNVSNDNEGMSNSLLKPKGHLVQHPDIVFTEVEEVEVCMLDDIPFDRHKFNCLVMDCQGGELNVLKGAIETLHTIDVIYTEVNKGDVYEGCAKVWELDEFLKEFKRVETGEWIGDWSDALYVRK